MAEVASAFVSIMPSAKGFGTKLNSQVSGELDSSGKKMGSRLGAAMKTGLLAGGAAIGALLATSIRSASEAQQAIGGVEAVFGKYADGVLADSKKAAQGLGLSAAAYNELITASGAMLKNKGLKDFAAQSTNLVRIGADLSAQFGGSTKEAVDALNSAMRGESDPIERYGIALNAAAIEAEAVSSGLVKNVKNFDKIKAAQNTAILAQRKYNAALKENGKGSDEALAAESSLIRSKTALSKALEGEKLQLTDSQKAQAALSLVQKQSADAAGAFGRESNTLAGQQARLAAQFDNIKASIGTGMLPLLTKTATLVNSKVLPAFSKTGKVLGDVAEFAKRHDVALASLAVTISAVVLVTKLHSAAMAIQAAGGLAALIKSTAVVTKLTKAYAAVQWVLNAALAANPIGVAVVALVALGAGLVIAYKNSKTFRDVVTKALEGVKSGFDALAKAGIWLWNKALQPTFKFIVNGVASILSMWSSMLSVLGKVPGFGWAKDAAESMANASDKARAMADGIKKIPANKTVKITVVYAYQGKRNAGKESQLDSLGRQGAGGLPPRKSFLAFIDKTYGDAGVKLFGVIEKGIKAATPKTVKAAQDAFSRISDRLTETRDNLKGTLDGLKDDFASLAESVSSAFAGNLFEATTASDFMANLTAKKGELSGLLASFKTLQGWGLPGAFLSQLFASGNGALITELAGLGQTGALGAANLFGDVQSLGNQLGNAVASNDPVAKRIDETNKQLTEVNRQLSFLADDIGGKLNGAAAKAQRDKKNRGKK